MPSETTDKLSLRTSVKFKRIASKEDSPAGGFVYDVLYGDASREQLFEDHASAFTYQKRMNVREDAVERAELIFSMWPHIEEFYITQDGSAFIKASDARDKISTLPPEERWFTEVYKDEI